jgi:hypothetical protein
MHKEVLGVYMGRTGIVLFSCGRPQPKLNIQLKSGMGIPERNQKGEPRTVVNYSAVRGQR